MSISMSMESMAMYMYICTWTNMYMYMEHICKHVSCRTLFAQSQKDLGLSGCRNRGAWSPKTLHELTLAWSLLGTYIISPQFDEYGISAWSLLSGQSEASDIRWWPPCLAWDLRAKSGSDFYGLQARVLIPIMI